MLSFFECRHSDKDKPILLMINPDSRAHTTQRTGAGLDIATLLRKTTVLAELPEDALHELAVAARGEHFDAATLINAAGQPLARVRLVVKGAVEILARRSNGTEVVLGDIGPGGWATWVGCFAPQPPDHDFYSTPDATFIALPVDLVREIAFRYPALFPRVIADLGVRMRQLMEWTGDSVLLGSEQRMAYLIYLLARMQGNLANNGHGTVQVTQSRLAQLARCSRQSANLLVGALERRGLINGGYGRFDIADMARLIAFIESDPEPS